MTRAQWPDRDRVEQYVANHPDIATNFLAEHLKQMDLDALFQRMFPPPTDHQKRLALRQARQILTRADFSSQSHTVRSIDTELANLASDHSSVETG